MRHRRAVVDQISAKQDTWVITCYFNPLGYRTRRANFIQFASSLAAQGAPLLVVEMAGPTGHFDLDEGSYNCIRVNGDGLMWQKERMLNLALRSLPQQCRKVAWVDADIIFESPDWLKLTSEALERDVVVQPFSQGVRLPPGHIRYNGESQEESGITESFAACYKRDPTLSRTQKGSRKHGHTGYAWAAQRDFLETCRLYDACITGGCDHLMAHVFAGSLSSACISGIIGEHNARARHFTKWAEHADSICKGRLGFVPGMISHLWHGTLANRRYQERHQEFRQFDFDPERDLRTDSNGLWAWSDSSNHLRAWSLSYFKSRNEDDMGPQP